MVRYNVNKTLCFPKVDNIFGYNLPGYYLNDLDYSLRGDIFRGLTPSVLSIERFKSHRGAH